MCVVVGLAVMALRTAGTFATVAGVGAFGALLAAVCALVTSRSLSKPVGALVEELRVGEDGSQFPQEISAGDSMLELECLTDAYNSVAREARRAFDNLEKATAAAQTANQAKTEFMCNASHQLRTSISGVIGMTELLLDTGLTEEQHEYALTVHGASTGLIKVIEDVLDFSRLENDMIVIKPEPFDLRQTVHEVVRLLAPPAVAKQIALAWSYPDEVRSRFIGDGGRIRQVLTILAANAVKFTPEGRVEVAVEVTESASRSAVVQISVSDTGIGIPAHKVDAIFGGLKPEGRGGLGLGLAIVRRMVELMEGRVSADSMPGAGSTFRVTLPLEMDTTAPASTELLLVGVPAEPGRRRRRTGPPVPMVAR
jgi:signal transduction histidine kinase